MGKFIEGKIAQKMWFKKMNELNHKTENEISELFKVIEDTVFNYNFIQQGIRKKPLKDYTETNANYIWIACDKAELSIRYHGKLTLLHILYRDFGKILSTEEIQTMTAEGDLELAAKLGFDAIESNKMINTNLVDIGSQL